MYTSATRHRSSGQLADIQRRCGVIERRSSPFVAGVRTAGYQLLRVLAGHYRYLPDKLVRH